MTDVLGRLTEAAWRGIEFPIAHREFGFSQDTEAHRFIFRDEQLIESLGLTNPTYRYNIPFREDLARGSWKNLFVDVYPKFLEACIDRTKGILLDPIHGPVQVKVTSLQEIADPGRRDGVDVEVNFISAPDEDFQRVELGTTLSTIEGAEGLQHALDTNLSSSDLDDDTKKQLAELNKDASPARLNPLQFATGAVNQVEAAGNKIAAQFGQVANQAQALDDGVRRVARPDLQPIRSNARQLQLAALDLARTPVGGNSQRGKAVRIYNVPNDTGTLSLASKLHMSVQEFIKLNPLIGRSPTVATGTAVFYFA
jgi:prophage DNA circulation protein